MPHRMPLMRIDQEKVRLTEDFRSAIVEIAVLRGIHRSEARGQSGFALVVRVLFYPSGASTPIWSPPSIIDLSTASVLREEDVMVIVEATVPLGQLANPMLRVFGAATLVNMVGPPSDDPADLLVVWPETRR